MSLSNSSSRTRSQPPSWWRAIGPALALLGAAALGSAACDRSRSTTPVTSAPPTGTLNVEVQLRPDPPRTRGNSLEIFLRDGAGQPVDGARVAVRYTMPAMGAMPEMRGEARTDERGGGRYRARFDLPAGGSWTLAVEAAAGDSAVSAEYGLTVGRQGLTGGRMRQTGRSGTAPGGLDPAPAETLHAHEGEVAHYTCSMHPSVRSEVPGTCPICSMDLVPVTRRELATGAIRLDARQRQTIGVTTTEVERRPLTTRIRAVGRVTWDERRLTDVSLKVEGWIGRLVVDATGQRVEHGQTLFTFYSPELYSAQQELLAALASQAAARSTTAPERADALVAAARTRLRLWDLSEALIDEIVATGRPLEQIPIVSPAAGWVVEKNVVAGATVEPGARLYRLAGLERVWVEAEVYESDLPLVAAGQDAIVTLTYLPGRSFPGRVTFVYPYLDPATRTGRARIELANPGLVLKPDMYANVDLHRELGEWLVVPESAVLHAGERSFVFRDLGGGQLRPQAVELGTAVEDDLQVLSGLAEGDLVVTSGNFLVAAEARLKQALENWQ